MESIGKIVVIAGLAILFFGVLLLLLGKLGLNLFQLPGDILVRKQSFTFYFPVATSLIISLILTIVFYFFSK